MIDAESDGCEMNVVDSNDGLMQSWSCAVANKSVKIGRASCRERVLVAV